jgi:hypothetical protein
MSNMPKLRISGHYETQWKLSSFGASLSSSCYIKADEIARLLRTNAGLMALRPPPPPHRAVVGDALFGE